MDMHAEGQRTRLVNHPPVRGTHIDHSRSRALSPFERIQSTCCCPITAQPEGSRAITIGSMPDRHDSMRRGTSVEVDYGCLKMKYTAPNMHSAAHK